MFHEAEERERYHQQYLLEQARLMEMRMNNRHKPDALITMEDMSRYAIISSGHAQLEKVVDTVTGNEVKISGNMFGSNKALRHSAEFGQAVERLREMARIECNKALYGDPCDQLGNEEPLNRPPHKVTPAMRGIEKKKGWTFDENKDPVYYLRLKIEKWINS